MGKLFWPADRQTKHTLHILTWGNDHIIYTYRMGFKTSWMLSYSNRYLWENNLINLQMHKTSSYVLQRFNPEGASSGNTRLETCFTKKKTFVKRVSAFRRLIRVFSPRISTSLEWFNSSKPVRTEHNTGNQTCELWHEFRVIQSYFLKPLSSRENKVVWISSKYYILPGHTNVEHMLEFQENVVSIEW